MAEYRQLAANPTPGIYIRPSLVSHLGWPACFPGARSSQSIDPFAHWAAWDGVFFVREGLYAGGVFKFRILLPQFFPNFVRPVRYGSSVSVSVWFSHSVGACSACSFSRGSSTRLWTSSLAKWRWGTSFPHGLRSTTACGTLPNTCVTLASASSRSTPCTWSPPTCTYRTDPLLRPPSPTASRFFFFPIVWFSKN
jgi:hypothetical protein